MNYQEFLISKIKIAEKHGFDITLDEIHPILKPHQKAVVQWNVKGGRRANFLSFGLGKTLIQLETCRQVLNKHPNQIALIVCPLGVKHEFVRDAKKIGIEKLKYITSTNDFSEDDDTRFFITNYERIRKGDIDAGCFKVICFDEASILRGLDTQTVEMIMNEFKDVPFRYVCTATPSPNRFLELTGYADFLGIMDRGQILTRFFQRDSTTAGNLTLYARREKEFWYWMSSWACFITKPSDLGFDDTGYDLPPITIHRHLVSFERETKADKRNGQISAFADASKSLPDASKEKRDSQSARLAKMKEIIAGSNDNFVIWHHLESERTEIQKLLGDDCKSVYGNQNIDEREDYLIGFSEGKYKYLSTKPTIAGSGCNFQYHCHKAIFVGIDYKFNDFIQPIHRIYRFMQERNVEIHIVYTDAEDQILKTLEQKWANHLHLQNEMTEIIKKHGLNSELYKEDLSREMFTTRKVATGQNWTAVNNDNVDELPRLQSNSIGLYVTSIPFGNHYEYSENYNCFGHNESNEAFFEQMDFLTPEVFRTLMPGRICAVHVKDRIRYSYMNGTGFTSIEPFSDHTSAHFIKHGFHLIGRVTITTDVVQENNQTYRLGWSEQCKDGTKMGVGLPEYLLIFRKPPTDSSNAYADLPVVHSKENYTRDRWQLDAHAYWKSSGERLLDTESLKRLDLSDILKLWKELERSETYDFNLHAQICAKLEAIGKLPSTFMAIPPISNNPDVWTDIVRMKTLNSEQAKKNETKHICPLQLDVIERTIERYSNPGEIVADFFGGIMSVPFQAVKMGRKGWACELNTSYWKDGIKHLKSAEIKQTTVLTLF